MDLPEKEDAPPSVGSRGFLVWQSGYVLADFHPFATAWRITAALGNAVLLIRRVDGLAFCF
jgi:hypothetical protein